MFTGIVEEVGVIEQILMTMMGLKFFIKAKLVLGDLKIGDSIAVNGVCLTVIEHNEEGFWAEAVAETLRLTTLGFLKYGNEVNLERALTPTSRMGGHYVQGHVDGVAEISEVKKEGEAWLVKFQVEKSLAAYMVKKGYVAIDGMSITLIEVNEDSFSVTFIPHTREVTIVKHYRARTLVNIEVDILGKYAEKFLQRG
ncbi:MAG: riboflavin synthase [Gammaproteobacteria bacterium]|jgi:riboflavin synthase|nr:riboflavin synthase [Gammaproteobacteria bacterium]